jgi:flagellar motor switch protein FliN
MTESTAASQTESSHYIQIWAESFAQVLGQISSSSIACVVLTEATAELSADGANDLWIVCACSGGIRGEMSLRISPASGLRLAQIFISEPAAPEAALTPEHREAAVELLRQVAGLVATTLKPKWGEVQLRIDPATAAPSWPASSTLWLRVGDEGAVAAMIEMQLSAALAATLRAEKTEAVEPDARPVGALPAQVESKVKLDLLMDVELAITLRFGSRRLLLREVLDLNPGAVVELDRQVEEPVDVLLDGRLLARGEVVVLNGNYGLRVTEVAPAGTV